MKSFKEFLKTIKEVQQHHVDVFEDKLDDISPENLPLNNLFKGKYRIAIPFEDSKLSKLKLLIQNYYTSKNLPNLVDVDVDWIKGQIVAKYKNPNAGKTFIDKKTRQPAQVPEHGEKRINIAKFLSKESPELLDWWSTFMDTSAIRPGEREQMAKDAGEYSIIMTRYPIDILRMSDWRHISSCHAPPEKYGGQGEFTSCKQETADGGGLAFLVKTQDLKGIDLNKQGEIFEDDDRDIEGIEPKARVRFRRFTSTFPDEKTGDEFDLAIPELSPYGTRSKGFVDKVTDWLRNEQEDLIKRNGGRENFTKENFKLRGGKYRDNSDSALFNNFFKDLKDSPGNTVHSYEGEETITDMTEQYTEELNQMEKDWNERFEHCHASWEEYWDSPTFDYMIYSSITIDVSHIDIVHEPDEEDLHGRWYGNWARDWTHKELKRHGISQDWHSHDEGKKLLDKHGKNSSPPEEPQSLKDAFEDYGLSGLSGENASFNNGKIILNFAENEDDYSNRGDDGRHPDAFDEHCDEMYRNWDQDYDKVLKITIDWLINRKFMETPPARYLEEKIESGKLRLRNFELYERDKKDEDEIGIAVIGAKAILPIKTSSKLAGDKGTGWDLKTQVGENRLKIMFDQIKKMFLGSLQAAERHYDRQQWLPLVDKAPNPYKVSKDGTPTIQVDSDYSGNITIDVEFNFTDSDSEERIINVERNLMAVDRNWSDLLKTAQQVIQKTLMDREQEEYEKAQGDQQKLSGLLRKQRPVWPPQTQQPKLIEDPPVQQTPEEIKSQDLRDRILKRGKYAKL